MWEQKVFGTKRKKRCVPALQMFVERLLSRASFRERKTKIIVCINLLYVRALMARVVFKKRKIMLCKKTKKKTNV